LNPVVVDAINVLSYVKNYGHAECTKFKFEMEQTIINANMEIKDRTSDNRKSIKQTRVKQVPG
jgi:hypothetical protein